MPGTVATSRDVRTTGRQKAVARRARTPRLGDTSIPGDRTHPEGVLGSRGRTGL